MRDQLKQDSLSEVDFHLVIEATGVASCVQMGLHMVTPGYVQDCRRVNALLVLTKAGDDILPTVEASSRSEWVLLMSRFLSI